MHHPLRVFALACVLAVTPACAALPKFENPVASAHAIDQQAYALLSTYAAVLEEAADVVADPATPAALRRSLGQAERAATPAVETLQIAIRAYLRAKADLAAGPDQDAFVIAARRLGEAIEAARAPIGALQALVRAR